MWLTKSSLFGLMYRKRDGSQQFDEDLYDDLGHRRGRWDFCIDVEAPEEGFERLEKLYERVIVRAGRILDCLEEATGVTNSSRVNLDWHLHQEG